MLSLIVSLHDVSPLTQPRCAEILHGLAQIGVHRTSLLVIPNHHHRAPFLADKAFCDWLKEARSKGHEIVTHGYFHQRIRTDKENPFDRMITRLYTADEGEFFDIHESDALKKMLLAQEEFAMLGIYPEGFIAPAWLLSREAESAARKAGFRYTTTLREIRVLDPENRTFASQSLVYSVRSAWRRFVSLGWNRFLLACLHRNSVIRLSIHPPDWNHAPIRRDILRIARLLALQREPITYSEWTRS